jgi:transcriptional regulator with XRE-family HTH domain
MVQIPDRCCFEHCVSADTSGNDVPVDVAQRLSNFRQLARLSGLSHSHISRVLRGEKGCTFHVAAVIAQAANVRLDHLYNYILQSPSLRIRTRRTRQPRAASVITPITNADTFPEVPTPPAEPIRYMFP